MLCIEMGKMFDMLTNVNPERESWCFNVRVIRLWTVYSTTKPGHLNSLEMILIDEKGTKIHASIAHNSIEKLGLSLTTIGNIRGYGPDHEFLVDVVGLVMRTSSERECIRDGKTTKEVVLHMFDNRGGGGLPIIVIQFAKIRYEEGKISIENYLNVTRILLNPIIPEMIAFKESLAIVGVVCVGLHTRPSIDEDFLTRNPPDDRNFYEEGDLKIGARSGGLEFPTKLRFSGYGFDQVVNDAPL
ncbi:hypothetical protein P8452_38464 [Trifolium repens]|nr:hypothetical protein P8452_38464 [Trifolium repens]